MSTLIFHLLLPHDTLIALDNNFWLDVVGVILAILEDETFSVLHGVGVADISIVVEVFAILTNATFFVLQEVGVTGISEVHIGPVGNISIAEVTDTSMLEGADEVVNEFGIRSLLMLEDTANQFSVCCDIDCGAEFNIYISIPEVTNTSTEEGVGKILNEPGIRSLLKLEDTANQLSV